MAPKANANITLVLSETTRIKHLDALERTKTSDSVSTETNLPLTILIQNIELCVVVFLIKTESLHF